MKVEPRRGWFRIDLPAEWRKGAVDAWESPSGARLEACEIARTAEAIEADALVELHESWCAAERLHPHETRIEQLASGVLMVRSYGETGSDEFLMGGHFTWNGRLARLSFRTSLGSLRDEDLAEALAVFLEFHPTET